MKAMLTLLILIQVAAFALAGLLGWQLAETRRLLDTANAQITRGISKQHATHLRP